MALCYVREPKFHHTLRRRDILTQTLAVIMLLPLHQPGVHSLPESARHELRLQEHGHLQQL
jgi:hypothetical protein